MTVVRSVLIFFWMVLSVIPLGLGLVLSAPFLRSDKLWWWFAIPYLRGVIFAARHVGGVKYKIHGEEHLPLSDDNQRIILCSKHQSAWETFFFPGILPHPTSYVFKRELLWIPIFGWALGCVQRMHIDRSRRSEAWGRVAELGGPVMDSGSWVIMFPEGTRTERGSKGRYKTGATRLAVLTGASVIPVAVTSGRCWPRRSFWLRPGVIDVSFGRPISSKDRDPDELMAEIEDWIELEMNRLDPEAYIEKTV